jgi:hypothetical protein
MSTDNCTSIKDHLQPHPANDAKVRGRVQRQLANNTFIRGRVKLHPAKQEYHSPHKTTTANSSIATGRI